MGSKEYYKVIASAKYLINDNTFQSFFIKKDGQIYLNTWHGTPLKTLGREMVKDFHNIGNAQKNFIVADYLLYPNEFTFEKITNDYMIKSLTKATHILAEYPRNEGLVWDNVEKIKEEMNLTNKKIYTYMPTWRGVVSKIDSKSNTYIQYFLYEIDKKLKDDEILFVNLHPIASKGISFYGLKKIKKFPDRYETYDFLKISDVLITDYSSVMFDYMQTGKKCVLFTFDKEEYFHNRGLYINLKDLPFKQTENIEDLMNEIRSMHIKYENKDINKFIPYDARNVTEKILDLVIFNKNNNLKIIKQKPNQKENVLIYAGSLQKNGITTAMKNLIENLDLNKRNYYLTFYAASIAGNSETLNSFPKEINYIGIMGKANFNIVEKIVFALYGLKIINYKLFFKCLKKAYGLEIKRNFGNIQFSNVIHYTGYGYKGLTLFSQFNSTKTVFVHSNMVEEVKNNRVNPKRLDVVYHNYDNIAIVTNDMFKPTKQIMKNKKIEKIKVINNVIDYQNIKILSKCEVSFDKNTISSFTEEELLNILENKKSKKYITIGRYSKEKGHFRLINAFNRIWVNNKDTYLIIIGGHGNIYEKTINYIASLECGTNIITIKSISNPFPILKKCDYFVLSSFYEGFGLVLAEADILGLPVISTDILGPRTFMKENGGKLVPNSEDGIYEGMLDLLNGKIKAMNIDYEEYNRKAIHAFENLLKK
ncbi:MAG: glycosyltransferase [Bacillota bacterium]|nr:glycosyltransferase [Bacillota bacterium]